MSSSTSLPEYASYKYFNITSPSTLVYHVETNRPEKLNAFNNAMWPELGRVFTQISHDKDVRAVIFSGAGDRAFTAGLDVQEAASSQELAAAKIDAARQGVRLRRYIEGFQTAVSSIERCEKPVICVMHGISYGLAIDLAVCADVRIASRETRFSVKEVDIGIAADVGTLTRLPRVVGSQSWVKDVCLTARIFGAAEALAQGFLSQVHESKAVAVAAATQMAELLAAKSPVAVQGTKELLNHGRDQTIAESLRYTGAWNAAAVQTKDVQAAVLSSFSKKKPTFEKL